MKKLFPFFASFILLASCEIAYIPTRLNVPLLQKKHEKQITLAAGLNSNTVQFAYSPAKHYAIAADLSYSKVSDTGNIQNKTFAISFAPGYYRNIYKNFFFEIYPGLEYYQNFNVSYFINGYDTTSVKLLNFYLQPNIGWQNQYFRIAFTLQFNYLQSLNYYYSLQDSIKNPKTFSITPAITAWVGYKFAYFTWQLGYSFHTNSTFKQISFPFIFNFGVTFKF